MPRFLLLFLLFAVAFTATIEEEDEFDVDSDDVENVVPEVNKRDSGSRQSNRGEYDSEYDQDEFVGDPTVYRSPQSNVQGSAQSAQSSSSSNSTDDSSNGYLSEYLAMTFIVLYIVNFFIGKRKNEKIAESWHRSFQSIFENQFFYLGDKRMLKESQSCFKYYCSGRRHCQGLLATLELRKRQDLFSLALSTLDMSPSVDTLTVEIPLSDAMEPFVFAIVRRRHLKRVRKSLKDLENYTQVLKSERIPSNFSILSDCPELERHFLDEKVIRILRDNDPLVVSIHLSDENAGVSTRVLPLKLLRFQFKIPAIQDMEQLRPLLLLAIHFIDVVADVRLSAQARAQALHQRKLVAEQVQKAERAEAQARRKEQASSGASGGSGGSGASQPKELTAEQLRKKEARLAKKRQPKVKVIR